MRTAEQYFLRFVEFYVEICQSCDYIIFKRRAGVAFPLPRAGRPPPGNQAAEHGVCTTTPGLTRNIGNHNVTS